MQGQAAHEEEEKEEALTMTVIAFVILLTFGWQLAKLFDKTFIDNGGPKAIPPHSGYNHKTVDNLRLIASLKKKKNSGTVGRRKAISEGRASSRRPDHRHYLEQAGRRGHGKNVLPHNPRGDV